MRAFRFAPFPSPVGDLGVVLSDGRRVSLDAVDVVEDAEGAVGAILATEVGGEVVVACGTGAVRLRSLGGGRPATLLPSTPGVTPFASECLRA